MEVYVYAFLTLALNVSCQLYTPVALLLLNSPRHLDKSLAWPLGQSGNNDKDSLCQETKPVPILIELSQVKQHNQINNMFHEEFNLLGYNAV
jgi:hypothetical protein